MNRATPLVATALAALMACGEADRRTSESGAPAAEAVAEGAAVTQVTPAHAAGLLASDPGIFVLDVRTPEEFAADRLEGAVNVPVDDLEEAIAQGHFTEQHTRPVLVYCRSGGRSARAASILAERGYRVVFDLTGGLTAWQEAGLTVER